MTLHLSQESIDKVLPNIKERANYQRRFLLGYQRVSGGDLKGKANRYGLSYKTSRNKVFGLLHDAGIYFLHTTGQNGLREVFEVGIPITKDCRINGLTKDDMNILRKSVIENNPSILFLCFTN